MFARGFSPHVVGFSPTLALLDTLLLLISAFRTRAVAEPRRLSEDQCFQGQQICLIEQFQRSFLAVALTVHLGCKRKGPMLWGRGLEEQGCVMHHLENSAQCK